MAVFVPLFNSTVFSPVMFVQCDVDQNPSLQVPGIQAYHLIVCTAVGIDHAWYREPTMWQNSPMHTTSP